METAPAPADNQQRERAGRACSCHAVSDSCNKLESAKTPLVQSLVGQEAGNHQALLRNGPSPTLLSIIRALQRTAGNSAVVQLLAPGAPTATTVQRDGEETPRRGGAYESEEAQTRVVDIENRESQALDPPDRSPDVKYYLTVLPPALSVATEQVIPLENTLMMLAQAQVEHSKTIPAGNMIFGITTKSTDSSQYVRTATTEAEDGRLVRQKNRKFRRYASPEESVRGYLKLLGGEDPEHDLYKKNEGLPLKILKEGDASKPSDVGRFQQAVLGGGYSSQVHGACDKVGSKESPQFVYKKGYNQLFPAVFNQILGEFRGKASVVDAVSSVLRIENGMLEEVSAAYEELANSLEVAISDSSEESEKIRRDAAKLRTRAAELRSRIDKNKKTLELLQLFKGKIGGVKPVDVPPDWKCNAEGRPVP